MALKNIISFIALCACSLAALAKPLENQQEIKLWPKKAPGSENVKIEEQIKDASKDPVDPLRSISGISVPTITAYLPQQANGTAVLITPGGGYTNLVFDKEGRDIALWVNKLGITAFVLKSRLPGEGHIDGKNVPLQDAQRAMRLIRAQAEEWKLDTTKLGVMGFSAGGHLASMLGTNYDKSVYKAVDKADKLSARPDFMVLAYGPHSGNARALLINPEQKPMEPVEKQVLYDEYPTSEQVTKETPVTFMVAADNDDKVDARNSTRFYDALKKNGVGAELHIFQEGKHGFALRNAQGTVALWPQLCENWLRANKIIP